MSWQDRVNDSIYLKSPSGQPFRAFWQGDKRSKDKKLGVFEYPGARGAIIQDLDVGPVKYPTTLYFEGPTHDLEAARFWAACDERGTWEMLHPVHGNLTLQLVTVSQDTQPVTSGNITAMDTDWLEVGIDNPAASTAQLEDDVTEQIDNLQAAASDQFVAKVKVNKPSLLAQLKSAVAKVLAKMAVVTDRIAAINAKISAVRQTVLGLVTSVVLGVASLAGAVTSLIMLPGLILQDIRSRFDYFERVIATAATLDPDTASAGGVNAAAMHELVATACLSGMAQAVVDASFTTRDEALRYLERMHAAFITVTANLDSAQALYSGSTVDRQYFSQTASFHDMTELLRRVQELLLRRSFDLAAAKHLTLRRDRAPVEIALTEGVDLDSFIASNALKGDEILLLPTGRQVVIYL